MEYSHHYLWHNTINVPAELHIVCELLKVWAVKNLIKVTKCIVMIITMNIRMNLRQVFTEGSQCVNQKTKLPIEGENLLR